MLAATTLIERRWRRHFAADATPLALSPPCRFFADDAIFRFHYAATPLIRPPCHDITLPFYAIIDADMPLLFRCFAASRWRAGARAMRAPTPPLMLSMRRERECLQPFCRRRRHAPPIR
jgi:hypothetical protein